MREEVSTKGGKY